MPHGDDFLDALNDIFNDGGQMSIKAGQQCSKCHKRIQNQMESQGLGNLIPICDACSTAGLIDFDDGDGGTYSLVDFTEARQTKQKLKKIEEHRKKQDYKSERITKYYIDKDGRKRWGKDPDPKPSRFATKPNTKAPGRWHPKNKYFYDAYGNLQKEIE